MPLDFLIPQTSLNWHCISNYGSIVNLWTDPLPIIDGRGQGTIENIVLLQRKHAWNQNWQQDDKLHSELHPYCKYFEWIIRYNILQHCQTKLTWSIGWFWWMMSQHLASFNPIFNGVQNCAMSWLATEIPKLGPDAPARNVQQLKKGMNVTWIILDHFEQNFLKFQWCHPVEVEKCAELFIKIHDQLWWGNVTNRGFSILEFVFCRVKSLKSGIGHISPNSPWNKVGRTSKRPVFESTF